MIYLLNFFINTQLITLINQMETLSLLPNLASMWLSPPISPRSIFYTEPRMGGDKGFGLKQEIMRKGECV